MRRGLRRVPPETDRRVPFQLSDQVIGRVAGSSWNGTRRGMQFRQLIRAASALVMAGAPPLLGQGSPALIAGDPGLQSLGAETPPPHPTVPPPRGARAEEGAVSRELTTAMAVAYYRLGYTAMALETLRHQRELLEAAVQLSTTRYATGAAPQSDPLQAKLARDRLQSEAFALESERVAALAAVNALRNRAPGDSLSVVPMDAAQVRAAISPLPPSDSLVALALAAHPRLAARRAAIEQATRTIQVERLGARPDFTLTA